jgi:sugar lactone lactonase YvrE
MCAFGGSRLDTLFVTSIRPDDQSEQSLAGGVFALNPASKACRSHTFTSSCIAVP